MEEVLIDFQNDDMRNAYDMVVKTRRSFFLTGRAGTGKTTFLREIQQCVRKKFVVLAPSGIAAINAGGQTIHSFFGFNLGVQGPLSCGNMNTNKISLVRTVDTIIIDEASMVRCDILDAVDRTLRYYRHSSQLFGGLQMILVGDLFQLPPIVNRDDMDTMRHLYGSDCGFFFHNARCLRGVSFPKIEFRKIYRQNDARFIGLLEHFRVGRVTAEDLRELNSRVKGYADSGEGEMRISLTAYRNDAKRINECRLSALRSEERMFVAEYSGSVDKLRGIVEDELVLKVGAQVMFTKNDSRGRWANGTIGEVSSFLDNNICVSLENGAKLIVERDIWEAVDYKYDETKKVCEKVVVGSVVQYPLCLAWAITIHKSQSLTFDKVSIDFGRGAFTGGQAYVALSRCRSLEGLQLVRDIDFASVKVSREAVLFASDFNDEQVISSELRIGEAVDEYQRIGDYDNAAQTLFGMADKEAHSGRIPFAAELMERALSGLADDDCLFGSQWTPLMGSGADSDFLDAAGLLYSGKTDDSLSVLHRLLSRGCDRFNVLYLLARALEIKEEWDEVESVYGRMMEIYREKTGDGLDSPSFRKFKYRVSVLNERQYGDRGADILVDLISENDNYDRYHSDLKWMLERYKDRISFDGDPSEEVNLLVADLMDDAVSTDDFIADLIEQRSSNTAAWRMYRSLLHQISRQIS